MPTFINGRPCQLSWGIDPELSRFIKVDEDPKNVRELQISSSSMHDLSEVDNETVVHYTVSLIIFFGCNYCNSAPELSDLSVCQKLL